MKSVQARHYHKGRLRPVRLVVCHDMEWAERLSTAEDCARMFATMDREASAHVCVDNNSAVRCVADADTAWAAPGANADGLQLEMAGFARQSRAEWLDAYSKAMLGQAAKVVAAWCKKYGIPVKHLTLGELKAGAKGIIGHIDATKAYGGSHTDPGPGFPWPEFLAMVRAELNGKSSVPIAAPDKPAPPKPVVHDNNPVPEFARTLRLTMPMMRGDDVRTWQAGARRCQPSLDVDGVFGADSRRAAETVQRTARMPISGVVDAETWLLTWVWEPEPPKEKKS